jgi:outer membrane protein assembly factor BamB
MLLWRYHSTDLEEWLQARQRGSGMQRLVISVILVVVALGLGYFALRAPQRRTQVIRGGLALVLALTAAAVLWWPVQGSSAPLDRSLGIYVPSGDNLLAIQASTGDVAWTFHASGPVQPPVVVEGIAYVVAGVLPSFDSALVYALNASDGSQRWHVQVNGHIVKCTPAVGEGVVYVTSTSGVDALNASDGSPRWHMELASSSTNPSSPALADGLLFFGAGMHPDGALGSAAHVKYCLCLYALRASDGAVVWTHPTGDQVFDAPTVVDGIVYASEFTDGLMALRASDGTLLWSQKGLHGTGSPTVANGAIYVAAADQRIYAVSATDGSKLWQTKEGEVGPSDGGLTVSAGVVYVVDTGVVALRASDGTRLWRQGGDSNRQLFSHPLVVEGVVFATGSCSNGFQFFGYCQDQLVALRGSDGMPFWSKTVSNPGAPVLNQEYASA